MATYESPRYKQLGFYVGTEYHQFNAGTYTTEDAAEIAVLDKITDVTKVVPEAAEKPAKNSAK